MKNLVANKNIKEQGNFPDGHSHNIVRLFKVFLNLPFTTTESMDDYYIQTRYMEVYSRLAKRLKK